MKHLQKAVILLFGLAALLPANDIVMLSGPLSAKAVFDFSKGSYTVTLTNLTTIHDAGNLLTDLIFNLTNTGGSTLSGTAGKLVNVDSTGAITTDTTHTVGWGFSSYNSLTLPAYNGEYIVCTICGGGVTAPNTPSQGILGPGGGTDGTPYSTANASIKGNGPHNPFILDSARSR
jgi:hypothetical protein